MDEMVWHARTHACVRSCVDKSVDEVFSEIEALITCAACACVRIYMDVHCPLHAHAWPLRAAASFFTTFSADTGGGTVPCQAGQSGL